MSWTRALALWLLIMSIETVLGTLRTVLVEPRVGSELARRYGVGLAVIVIVIVATRWAGWLGATTARARLAVGAVWVLSTVAFEVALTPLVGRSWADLAGDYDLTRGGLMGLGLVGMLLAPEIGWRLSRTRR
jgi:hypothetical protein